MLARCDQCSTCCLRPQHDRFIGAALPRRFGRRGRPVALDCRLFRDLPPLSSPDNAFGNRDDLFPNVVSADMLGIPAARDIRWTAHRTVDPDDRPLWRGVP